MLKKTSSLFLLCLWATACSPAPATPTIHLTPPFDLVAPTQPSCATVNIEPTPGPEAPSLFPPENATDRSLGASEATVSFIVYIDYQDSRSDFFVDVANQLLEEFPKDARFTFRPFPLVDVNDKSALAMQAIEAANRQGEFWDMHNLLFAQHENWANLSAVDFEQWVTAQASTLDMNVEQFQSDLKSGETVAQVQKYADDGKSIGIPGTPLVLINGQIYGGPRDHGSLRDIIALILMGKRQFTSCPPLTVQPDRQYIATLHTERGDITLELFADKAPVTVNSFIFLARNGWYDGITFHRVILDLFALTGDPSGTGDGNPGYYIINEFDPSLQFNRPGVVGMTNAGPNASDGQFFITFTPIAQYNGKYTIFGQLLTGMDVLLSLNPRDAQPGSDTPPGDTLLSVEIEEK